MEITILQTSDPSFYYPMMVETSKTVARFCQNNGLNYQQFVGLRRGKLPWSAAYNRVYLLKDLLDQGAEGWVLYMDADAMIVDQHFDLRTYFLHRDHHAAIFNGYCTPDVPHNINSGGFAINLSHPLGRALVLDYWRAVENIPDFDFDHALMWEKDIPEDQLILHRILDRYVRQGAADAFLFERSNEGYVNQGPFINQLLRSHFPTFDSRMAEVKRRVAEILDTAPPAWPLAAPGIYVPATHPRLATSCGEKKLGAICSIGQPGMLMFGPYVSLPAGRYAARVIGEAWAPAEGVEIAFDIVSENGETRWFEEAVTYPQAVKGVLLDRTIVFPRDLERVELRAAIGVVDMIRIHAIQFERLSDVPAEPPAA